MKRIESLTPEQIARFPEFVEKWTKIGLCTDPADRPAAESAIREMYTAAKLAPPRKIVWCGSPFSQGLVRAIVLDQGDKVRQDIGDSVRDSVWASVRDSVWASVRDSVRDSVWASVRDSVWASVRDSVGDSVRDSVWASVGDSVGASVRDSVWASVRDSVWASVRDSVWASVGDSVRDSVWASVGDSVGDSVWASVYGSHEAGWLSFYDYFRESCGLTDQTAPLSGLSALARSAGWAIPHAGICWVSERHCVLQRSAAGRLHCATGPAVLYPDGWAIYAINGTRIPAEWIEKGSDLDPEIALTWQNIEQRRAAAELIGWTKVLAKLDAKVIDEDRDPEVGTLLEVNLPDAPKERFLRVRCGTKREFTLPVPREMRTAIQANAWGYPGLTEDDIRNREART